MPVSQQRCVLTVQCADSKRSWMLSDVPLESRVPRDHPVRATRPIVDAALTDLSDLFDKLYARKRRRSIPPERLMRALVQRRARWIRWQCRGR